jgi:hypothetical protein
MRARPRGARCSGDKFIYNNVRQITTSVESASQFQSLYWRAALELIIVIVLVLLLFGSFPVFPYSREWGYRGSGVLGTILLIVVILWLLGKI